MAKRVRAPISDAIIHSVARLVDDAQTERREPSHSEIGFQINRSGLAEADPNASGQTVGKAKRVRATLSWAFENAQDKAELLVAALVSLVQANGGFRAESPNFVGRDAILNAIVAFRASGYALSSDGELQPVNLDTLDGVEMTEALEGYARRARRGSEDAALLVGTSKDLLEATASHILTERNHQRPSHRNFPTLLAQTFMSLGLAIPQTTTQPPPSAQCRLECALFEAGCSVNSLRNSEGTGHGRPWLPSVTDAQARVALQTMGLISAFLLEKHRSMP